MKVKGIIWLGTRTDHFEQMTDFCHDVMGLTQASIEPGFAVFDMPNGDRLEVFGPQQSLNTFMTVPHSLDFLVGAGMLGPLDLRAMSVHPPRTAWAHRAGG